MDDLHLETVPSTSKTTTTTTTTTSSTTTRTHAHAHAREEMGMLLEEYRDCIGEPQRFVLREMEMWHEQVGYDVMIYAIHQTAMAPVPSWRYMAAILRRCATQRVTGDQARADDECAAMGMQPRYQRKGEPVVDHWH